MSRTDDIRSRMRQLEAELAQLERFPSEDDLPNGTIITWIKVYDTGDDRKFSFAAIHANDYWWSTGRSTKDRVVRYDQLCTLIGDARNARVILPNQGVDLESFTSLLKSQRVAAGWCAPTDPDIVNGAVKD